jgi:hypothetical protein
VRKSFLLWVAGLLLGSGLIVAYPLARWGTAEVIWAVIIGAVLSTANAIAGFSTIAYAFGRSSSTFLKVVLGGMGVRMLALLGAVLGCLFWLRMHTLALTLSLLGFYAIFLALELMFIQKFFEKRT